MLCAGAPLPLVLWWCFVSLFFFFKSGANSGSFSCQLEIGAVKILVLYI